MVEEMQNAADDLYKLLGVPATATVEEVRNGYKEKALLHHPDRGGDPFQWTRIAQAYETLNGPRRAAYDRTKRVATGGAESEFAQSFGDGAFDLSEGKAPAERKAEKASIVEQLAQVKADEAQRGTVSTATADSMSHSAGFDAWIRNQRGLGMHGSYNAEDLLRKNKAHGGGIEATDGSAVRLPPLSALAVSFAEHGAPEEVLTLEAEHALPGELGHGEVLVHWLACCVHDDDLVRVQSPLSVLNDYPPFNRTGNKWEAQRLPAVAGGEGVGVVVATARNVPHLASGALDVNEWVVALPEARLAPVGTWRTLCACDAARLLRVPKGLMPLEQLACARSLCTAYRLLEDYGGLKPGDTLIQNGAELPTGQAVIQLCSLLKIRTINLVQDDEGFARTKEVLDRLGATHVLRDNAKLGEFLGAIGADMPRLALDAHGGDAGRRLAVALRPGGSLVVHSLSSGAAPQLSPSVLLYHQVSLHAFSLAHWTAQPQNGRAGYARMLRSLGDLARAEKLHLFTRAVPVAGLDASKLREALGSHRAVQSGATFRERSVFVFGDEASARDLSFELAEQIRQLEAEETAGDDGLPGGGVVVGSGGGEAQVAASGGGAGGGSGGGGGGSLARWADAQAMLRELGMEAYVPLFEEEEMTAMQLLRDIAARADGDKELMEAFKEMGIKKMGHRQAIVNAVLGLLP